MSAGTREELVFMAKLADQADRWEDVIQYMKRVADMGIELQPEERNVMSTAYKQSVVCCRQALREVDLLQKSTQGDAIRRYHAELQHELQARCQEVLDLTAKLLPIATSVDGQVFFQKMQGDYHRYLAEFATGEAFNQRLDSAQKAYGDAMRSADAMPMEDVLRLGLALNFSVFLYEVVGTVDPNGKNQAIAVARKSLQDAMSQNPQADETRQILALLGENLQLWTAGRDPDDGTVAEDL